MSFDERTGKYVRLCKQCDMVMTEPLKVGDKLYMFCSMVCRNIWDQERAYRSKPSERISDGD